MPNSAPASISVVEECALVFRRHPDLVAEVAGVADAADQAGAMPMSMRRIAMNGNAAFETSRA